MKLIWHDTEIECSIAVKNEDEILLYDLNRTLIKRIFNIQPAEWKFISLQNGEWTSVNEIPSEIDLLRADLDYCMMLLEETNEINMG